jgi:hypothetical protein
MFKDVKDNLGPIRRPDGSALKDTLVMPTQGVYADVSLGVCSGAEDWIEVNRHLDLAHKEQELEKKIHENEHCKLSNQRMAAGEATTRYTIDGDAKANVILCTGGGKCSCNSSAHSACGGYGDIHINCPEAE